MLRPAPRVTRSAIRLLGDSKLPQNSTLPNARSLHQRTSVHPSVVQRNTISVGPIPATLPRAQTRGHIEGLQTRSLASASRRSARYSRSDDRNGRTVVSRPLVGTSDDDLPRKDRKANPFLPFQASSFVDAFVTTIVGVGISESYSLQGCRADTKLNGRPHSFFCWNYIPAVVQMEGSHQGILHAGPFRGPYTKTTLLALDGGCLRSRI
jgi:hypothetical protein